MPALARITFGLARSVRGEAAMTASTPAPSAVRRTAPALPGFSTASTTITSGSSGSVRSSSRRRGARMTASRPSARSPNAILPKAASVVVVTGMPAAARASRAARASSPARRGSWTNASTTSTPASSARRTSRAPSTSVSPVASRSRRSRNRATALIRGFDGLARLWEGIEPIMRRRYGHRRRARASPRSRPGVAARRPGRRRRGSGRGLPAASTGSGPSAG